MFLKKRVHYFLCVLLSMSRIPTDWRPWQYNFDVEHSKKVKLMFSQKRVHYFLCVFFIMEGIFIVRRLKTFEKMDFFSTLK